MSLGLELHDLFSEDSARHSSHAGNPHTRSNVTKTPNNPEKSKGSGDADKRAAKRVFPNVMDAGASCGFGVISTSFGYLDANGKSVRAVIRWDAKVNGDGTIAREKQIRRASRPADGSGWILADMEGLHPLYRLPELLNAPKTQTLFVVEGEKCVEVWRSLGFLATTSGGSGSANEADWDPVSGRKVVISPDNDTSGERYAADVTQHARRVGAKSVQILRLSELWAEMPEKGDIVEFLEHFGGDIERVKSMIEAHLDNLEEATETKHASSDSIFQPFPIHALPEPIRSFIASAAHAIGCDASYIALPMLSALASAVGNTHRIELKQGWSEPAILWTAIIGESGSSKSPALELALRFVKARQSEAMKLHKAVEQQFEIDIAHHERELANWKKSKSNDAPPAKPDAPIAERFWIDDATTEGIAVLLSQHPRGLLLAKDELSGWFDFDRYTQGKGGDAAKWLEMFGGRPMTVDRKSTAALYVSRAAVSIAGGIQPKTLQRALGQEHKDNGLAARLLFAYPPRKPKRWSEEVVAWSTLAAVEAVFARLYALTFEVNFNGDEQPRLLTLAEDGKSVFVKFYNEHAREQVRLSDDEAAAWSKLEGYAPRFALVIHLARWAAQGGSLLPVDAESMTAGVELARWFGHEAKRVYAILSESDEDRELRKLGEWINRNGGTATARELAKGNRAYRGDTEKADQALSDLASAGLGVWEEVAGGARGGRPTRRLRLVTSVNVTETPLCDGDSDSSGDGADAKPSTETDDDADAFNGEDEA